MGRDQDCTLALADDATVSRRHASLTWEGASWVLRDLGSKNGTAFLRNGAAETVEGACIVQPGDEFLVGSALLRLETADSETNTGGSILRVLPEDDALVFEYAADGVVVERWTHADCAQTANARANALRALVATQQADGALASDESFLNACMDWTSAVLPPPLAQRLQDNADRTLTLLLAPSLLDLPWEALAIESRLLAVQRAVSRQVLLEQAPRLAPSRGRDFLIIANPTGDLVHVHEEAEVLLHALADEFGMSHARFLAGSRATVARVCSELERCSVVVYLGHAGHDPDAAGQGGWYLADGLLTGTHIGRLARVPALVVASACESAREKHPGAGLQIRGDTSGVAAAWMLGGVSQFIGTLWPVPVVSGAALGTVLLRGLLEGQPSGEAMLNARRRVAASYPHADATCAGYAHYGRPDWRLRP